MSQQPSIVTDKEPKRQKNLTKRQLLDDLMNFSREFKKLDPEITISTPQADRGIGPVHYNINLPTHTPVLTGHLRILNEIIKLEKFNGDNLIKLDASLLFLATGREDPLGCLPPGCRAAIRTEIQEATSRLNDKLKLAYTRDTDREILNDLIHSAESLPEPANPAEIALICDAVRPRRRRRGRTEFASRHPDYTYGGVKSITDKRRKEQRHIQAIRLMVFSQFWKGAMETIAASMRRDVESDNAVEPEVAVESDETDVMEWDPDGEGDDAVEWHDAAGS